MRSLLLAARLAPILVARGCLLLTPIPSLAFDEFHTQRIGRMGELVAELELLALGILAYVGPDVVRG